MRKIDKTSPLIVFSVFIVTLYFFGMIDASNIASTIASYSPVNVHSNQGTLDIIYEGFLSVWKTYYDYTIATIVFIIISIYLLLVYFIHKKITTVLSVFLVFMAYSVYFSQGPLMKSSKKYGEYNFYCKDTNENNPPSTFNINGKKTQKGFFIGHLKNGFVFKKYKPTVDFTATIVITATATTTITPHTLIDIEFVNIRDNITINKKKYVHFKCNKNDYSVTIY